MPTDAPSARVLIVDDDADIREALEEALEQLGYSTTSCASGMDALRVLDARDVDVVLTDLRMPSLDGIGLCEHVARNFGIPVILMTAFGEVRTAIDAMRADAFDFIIKPFDFGELAEVVSRAASAGAQARSPIRKLDVPHVSVDIPALIGKSPIMRELRQHISRIASSDASVLITGESGTGKELIARALHESGPRRSRPFVALNCAAVPGALLESELFGHVKGAFTGATEARSGLFLDAHGGTLLLDEIGAMPIELQPALLRALQERAVRPIGSTREEPFDARVLAATNRRLESAVAGGTFREDLLFRLEVLRVRAPPLRDRREDISELSSHFLEAARVRQGRAKLALSPAALEALEAYSWPGNVRELSNSIEAAAALAQGEEVQLADLPSVVREAAATTASAPESSLDHVRGQHIERVLKAVGGNMAKAARVLGIDRGTLYRRIRRARSDR